jgi:hypothetical protein
MTAFRRVLGYLWVRYKEPITCEACGGDFVCGATVTGCWCARVTLTRDGRAGLRQRYEKCLCRPCLERHAAGGDPA